MTLLEAIRNRMHPAASTGDSPEGEARELTDRYARLGEREAVAGL